MFRFLQRNLFNMVKSKTELPKDSEILPGRAEKIAVSSKHAVNGNATVPPFPDDLKLAMFGMGCFWGSEKLFWKHNGVYSTQVGYSGGKTPNPTYSEVCSGLTGHTEVVRVIFNPSTTSYEDLLGLFWEHHDPTQGMQQGVDVGTQYRSAIYYYDNEQKELAENSKIAFQVELDKIKKGKITAEIKEAGEFYYAEDYHQQYFHKNPGHSCGLAGTGATCPRPVRTKTT